MKAGLKCGMILLLALLALGSTGCVAQHEYDKLNLAYRRSQEQIAELKARLEEADARIKALQEAASSQDPNLVNKLEQAIAERDRLAKALADAESRLRAIGSQGPVLPAELDRALVDLAAQFPDLLEYDQAKGMVRFRSDLTFELGSTTVKPNAIAALQKLAEILRLPAAAGYEARIVGHTDNVRIARPETLAKHPTNWHLSVHRSISVKDVLEKANVQPQRLEVAGHGEFRPVVPNGPKGAEANRRVEIFLVPSTYGGAGLAGDVAGESRPRAAAPAAARPAAAPARPAAAPAEAPELFK